MARKRSDAGMPGVPAAEGLKRVNQAASGVAGGVAWAAEGAEKRGRFGTFGEPTEHGTPGDYAGAELTVTWGREVFRPLEYHNFEVGPFQLVVRIWERETVAQAHQRAMAELDAMAKAEFRRKLGEYLGRVKEVGSEVRARAQENTGR